MVQEGLRWWVEEAKKLQEAPLEVDEKEMNDEFGMMLHALEDSSKGAYTGDFALFAGREPEEHVIGPVPARHTAVELNTGIHDMILERTRQRIARYPVQEYGGLRSLASSALERNPISMKLDLLFPGSRLLVLKMGDAWLATVRLISGKPTKQILKSLPNNFRLIVICEQAPNAEVHLPKKVALLITIDALVAASEFVGDQPRYRPRLLEVLSTQQGSIESVEEMLKLMVLDTASAVERTQI